MGHSTTDNNAFNSDFSGYRNSDMKAHSTDGNKRYYGYINRWGGYFIEEQDDTNGSWRYYRGEGNYTTAWAARESLVYDYFDEIFKDA